MYSRSFKLLSLFSLLFISPLVFANMDCGIEHIDPAYSVEQGYTKEKIRQLCGEPTEIKNWKQEILIKIGNTIPEEFSKNTTQYSMWTYNRGSNTFVEYLLFKDGMLHALKDGEYGTD